MNYIQYLLLFPLYFFIPFAFGGTEPWALLLIQILMFVILIFTLINKKNYYFTKPALLISISFLMLTGLCIIQILNPGTILKIMPFIPFSICTLFTLQELYLLVLYFALFFVIMQNFENSEKQSKLFYSILIASFAAAITGILFQKGEYIQFLLGIKFSNAFGTFVNRNNAGSFFAASFFTAMAVFLPSFSRFETIKKNFFKFSAGAILCIFLFITSILTRSRGSMLGLFISIFIFLFILAWHMSWQIKKKILYLFFIAVLFLFSSFIIYKNTNAINSFSERNAGGFSEQARISLYKAGFDMLNDFPLTGTGMGAFSMGTGKYLDMQLNNFPRRIHSDWLELLVGIGYPAGTLFFILALSAVYLFLKRIKNFNKEKKIKFTALLCAIFSIAFSCLVDFHLHIPANAFIFFTVLALLSSSSFNKNKITYYKLPDFIKISFCLFFAATVYFSAKDAIAWRNVTFANKLSPENKINNYESALELSPNPVYAYNLILFYVQSLQNSSLNRLVKDEYYKKAMSLTEKYLTIYPFDSKFSYLYGMLKNNPEYI